MSRIEPMDRLLVGARPVAGRQLDFLAALDGDAAVPSARPFSPPRAQRGARAYHAGLAAEQIVERHYARRGRSVLGRRWRGRSGEVDLVLREGQALVFVEVKCSRSHDEALQQVSPRQIKRIIGAAGEYLAGTPEGQLAEVRFDVATVDRTGEVRILEGAFGL